MRIYFRCRRCRRALSDLPTQAGKPVICPGCKAEIIVPPGSEMGPPALENRTPTPVRCAPIIAEIPTVPVAGAIASIDSAAFNEAAPPAKTNPANAPAISARSTDKAWLYRIGAVAGVLLLLGTAGAVTSRMWPHQKDTAASVQPTEEQDQIAELDQTAIPPAPECCNACEPAEESNESEDKGEQSVVAKLDVQKNGNDLVNDLAKPKKSAGKPEVKEKPKTEADLVRKRRQAKGEEELRKDLAWVKEIGLGTTAPQVMANWQSYITNCLDSVSQNARLVNLQHIGPLISVRPDLAGLPFRQGNRCQLNDHETKTLGQLAKKLRLYLDYAAPLDEEGHRPKNLTLLREALRLEMRGKRPEWLRYEAVPAMVQLLMHEETQLRLILVDMLAEIPEKQATVALANRAVFDLAKEVREASLLALSKRKPEDYRGILLKGMSYPWAPAADHAAEAMIALNVQDEDSVSHLVAMLHDPDPATPAVIGRRGGFQREVVRANHSANCLMCHPPSANGNDGVLGVDPVVTFTSSQIQPSTIASRVSYPYPGGNPASNLQHENRLLIRGDITYVRQDFSVIQPVLRAGTTLPAQMRFDYFVRLQWIPEKLARELKTKLDEETTYSQRESVLFALRELTGQDAGPTSEAWQKLFPRAELNVEAANYRDQLVNASAKKRETVLSTLKDGEGVVYSLALADAIPKLAKDFQDKARQALAERLSRMTPETLRDKFADDDVEIRKAAIQACVMKGDASLVSDLSELLEDPSPAVAGLAGDAIKVLSKAKQKQKSSQATEVSSTKN